MEENKGSAGLALGIFGCVLSGISIWICGWLGFIGVVLGLLALMCSKGRVSAVVTGLIALGVGLFGGIGWAIIVSSMM